MPVNAAFVGREYPPSEPYFVSAAKIKEFADAIGATDPVHTDPAVARERGYRDVVAPPTFAVMLGQMRDFDFYTDPEAGVDLGRLVHGQQSFVHHRPLQAGDAVVGRLRVDSVREVAGNAMVSTSVELTVDGEPVTTTSSLIVVRAQEA